MPTHALGVQRRAADSWAGLRDSARPSPAALSASGVTW